MTKILSTLENLNLNYWNSNEFNVLPLLDTNTIFDQAVAQENIGGINFSVEWCTKKRTIRDQQFWVYCESTQDNFTRFTLHVPSLHITANSTIMKDTHDSLYIVEDLSVNSNVVKVYPLFCSSPTVLFVSKNNLLPLHSNDFVIQLYLTADDELPLHPNQQNAESVSFIAVKLENHSNEPKFPIGFTYKMNFKNRAEGWFKIQLSLLYKDILIAQSFSAPFVFNNPRMKKVKEHRLYTPRELKFMHVYTLANDKTAFVHEYSSLFYNYQHLVGQAKNLFPH